MAVRADFGRPAPDPLHRFDQAPDDDQVGVDEPGPVEHREAGKRLGHGAADLGHQRGEAGGMPVVDSGEPGRPLAADAPPFPPPGPRRCGALRPSP